MRRGKVDERGRGGMSRGGEQEEEGVVRGEG